MASIKSKENSVQKTESAMGVAVAIIIILCLIYNYAGKELGMDKALDKINETVDKIDQKVTQATIPSGKPNDTYMPLSSFKGILVVDNFLKSTLKDPSSLEVIECSPVITVERGKKYSVRYKYRAKNSFNAFVINEYIYYINGHNQITGYMEVVNGKPSLKPITLNTPFGNPFN